MAKLSEKRFEMSDQSTVYRYSIIDNENGVLKVNECVILLNKLNDENEQLKSLLKDAEEEIETLKKSNQCSMEALANKISKRVAEEPEVKECSFCGEFRTEYHEEDCCGNWSAEDFCNAGHDLEDTDPNSCKDYWDNF